MSSRLLAFGLVVVVLLAACSHENDNLRSAPTPATSSESTASSTPSAVPTSPAPSPTCGPPLGGKVSTSGSGFVVELNIMSGLPNPAWRLTRAQGAELRRLLESAPRGLDLDGPDELGGYGVTAVGAAVEFLDGLDLPEQFWVVGNGKVARFLGTTLPCHPIPKEAVTTPAFVDKNCEDLIGAEMPAEFEGCLVDGSLDSATRVHCTDGRRVLVLATSIYGFVGSTITRNSGGAGRAQLLGCNDV